MAVTRSTTTERARKSALQTSLFRPRATRSSELVWLMAGSILLLAGFTLIYLASTAQMGQPDAKVLNLKQAERREQLLPFLPMFSLPAERELAARKIHNLLQESDGTLPNVGAIARLRVTRREIEGSRRLDSFRERLGGGTSVSLFTGEQFSAFKKSVLARSPADFRNAFFLWAAVFFTGFWAAHLFWSFRGFTGTQAVLPAILLLTGTGFILMVTLRDPLRDTLLFAGFTQTAAAGCLVMAALSQLDYPRLLGRLSFVPLLLSFVLSIALIWFGTGPGVSDAKVNLFGFQPVEIIKVLIVFFLAGYFANRWELIRVLREKRPELAGISKMVEVPRLEYLLPLVIAVALTLVFFFLQKDLGPALVISCLFLALYSVARNGTALAGAGFGIMLLGFLAGYLLKIPQTVYNRVQMWLSPWDNAVRGGEQVVHSLWALATGGIFGVGLGLGDPEIMPAAHTDLVLSVLGEEWGFIGLMAAYTLYAVLIWTGIRTAMRARNDYSFFLALGLTLLITLEVLLISGGMLDLVPLSGVVTPFLSYGGSAMLTNFAIFAILLALSAQSSATEENTRPFHVPVKRLKVVLGMLALAVFAKAAWVQVLRADPIVGAGTLVVQADGYRRYQYNPRLTEIAQSIPRGSIYDRNGLPLATTSLEELEKHREDYQRIGVSLDDAIVRNDTRHYPLRGVTFHLLGDLRTRTNWGASNTSMVERDAIVKLQGYDDRARMVEVPHPRIGKPTYTMRYDYREIVPLLRHRYQPDHEEVRKVLDRDRNVRLTIDAELQMRTARILQDHLRRLKKEKGAAVVLDPENGDLLASVSYPWPEKMPPALEPGLQAPELLDRARYGLYPPGSTFKLVTAMAALRQDVELRNATYECKRLPDGRVGNFVRGWGGPIRDDTADMTAHGSVDMRKAIVVSCNAYFAQLATYKVGPEQLLETAKLMGIAMANPNTPEALQDALPQAAYGQGQVVASPFQMARVAAAVASGGQMPYGRWLLDESNSRVQEPQMILPAELADFLAQSMRLSVTNGTGRAVSSVPIPIAGKTGTAEIQNAISHAWFIGFAPYGGQAGRQVAFAVIVENARYGGRAAAPVAGDIVKAVGELGSLQEAR
ncbi:MAG: FtsW/RodA/SpoVE family cell cycle protein [Bryobacteraceae bacterium]